MCDGGTHRRSSIAEHATKTSNVTQYKARGYVAYVFYFLKDMYVREPILLQGT